MWESFFIALIQGVTEFLPISSSAHLIITRELWGWAENALLIDIAAHAGTLAAAMVYFRTEMLSSVRGALPRAAAQERHLFYLVLIASLPVLVIGGVLYLTAWVGALRQIEVIAVANLFFALLLLWADRKPQSLLDFQQMNTRAALGVGLFQVCALIPGASRAGTVITAMRALGYERQAAARFALFLALPSIGAAFFLALTQLEGGVEKISLMVLTALLSFGVALAVLYGFIRFSRKFSLLGFVVYRLALSALLFMIILG